MAIFFVFLGSPGQIFSPQTKSDTMSGPRDLQCRKANYAELSERNALPVGKAATFNLRGFYRCEKSIFEYGDRPSFDEFVTKHISTRANEIALKVAQFKIRNPDFFSSTTPEISVSIQCDRPALTNLLKTSMDVALVLHTRGVKVNRVAPEDSGTSAKLRVVLRMIDDETHFLGASIVRNNHEGTQWVDL